MKKKKNNLSKEVFILILLSILILLILAVALYEYVPATISVPEIREYSSDSRTTSIKQGIAYTNGGDATADQYEETESLKSYSIEASDLTVYGQKNLYNSGNSNPFDYATEEITNENTTTEGTTTGGNTTTNQQNNTVGETTTNGAGQATTGNTTTGTFFENPTSK